MLNFRTFFPLGCILASLAGSSGAAAVAQQSGGHGIVGGEVVNDTESLEYKHTVRLLVSARLGGSDIPESLRGLKMTWRCSGALLGPRVVLSAAHCFPKSTAVTLPDPQRVVRGELTDLTAEAYFKKDSRSDRPWGVTAERIIVHEGFREDWVSSVDDAWNPSRPIFDIALLSLSEPAPVDKAGVALLTKNDRPLAEGESLILAGYGRDLTDGQISIPRLRRVEVPYREPLRNETEWFVGRGDLTNAGRVGQPQGACMGDSGGPAFVVREGQVKLGGIIIRGPSSDNGGCEASVTIVTAVPEFGDWIEERSSDLRLERFQD